MCDGDRSRDGVRGGCGGGPEVRKEMSTVGKSDGNIAGIGGEVCDADVEAEADCGCHERGDARWPCFRRWQQAQDAHYLR